MYEDDGDDSSLRYHLRVLGKGYETKEPQERACGWLGFRVCDRQLWAYDFPTADLGALYGRSSVYTDEGGA